MAYSVLRVLAQPPPGPALTELTVARPRIAAGRAARVSYALSRADSVTFGVQRSLGGGRYTGALGTWTVAASPGYNTFTLTATQLGRRAGLYRLTVTPQNGAPQVVQFRVLRRR